MTYPAPVAAGSRPRARPIQPSHSTERLTVDVLHYASQRCLRTDTLKAANRALVNYQHQLPI
jgi:hypothetical protein